jgi:cytochrome P450
MKSAAIQGVLSPFLVRERFAAGVVFNPFTLSFREDPYPLYARLREQDPVHHSPLLDGYVLTRYEHVEAMLRDPRTSSNPDNSRRVRRIQGWMKRLGSEGPQDPLSRTMQRVDPPDHSRLRRLVNQAFTPRMTAQLRPRIEELVGELLGRAGQAGRLEVLSGLAHPLPVQVIARMIGIPSEEVERVERLADASINRRSRPASAQLREYLGRLVEEREREPRDDILSALLFAKDEGQRLTRDEIFSTCGLLMLAGHETTTHLMGNGLLALLRHPEQLQALRDAPHLIESAVEEMLRHDSPVQAVSRSVLEDLTIQGKVIQAGQQVHLVLGAANRDPERFPQPDALDISRQDNRHLSFGKGLHFCLGAPLARLEVQIALGELIRRFPRLRLAEPRARWRDNMVIRGLEALPVLL